MTFLKICGIASLEHAQTAVSCGANALGFVFALSKRQITPDLARKICSLLPETVYKVGVFVNCPRDEVKSILTYAGLTALQFHGDEPPEYCAIWRVPVWKGFRIQSGEDLLQLQDFAVDAYLLDASSPGSYGGTGKTCDWTLAKMAVQQGYKVILAGGLHPGNVEQAVQVVRPYGVDVSSGVETNGVKDPVLIQQFIKKVRAAGE
ncbi:phosphoribosylanthranilate isomerase [Zhaonella formicivorans]|jgi:phosphoribosylanthranilate isomerase|uniref:phosphoribosylanthranilate isomerase n=1 Tax=Zhaonella formicivorans TaxID=2528593 RepID=UPI0010EFD1EA|nr:phosphoribosylanthranilate isomerase [Zhaonella formicivorans]